MTIIKITIEDGDADLVEKLYEKEIELKLNDEQKREVINYIQMCVNRIDEFTT